MTVEAGLVVGQPDAALGECRRAVHTSSMTTTHVLTPPAVGCVGPIDIGCTMDGIVVQLLVGTDGKLQICLFGSRSNEFIGVELVDGQWIVDGLDVY